MDAWGPKVFADILQRYQAWIERNIPGVDRSPGMILLIWLLKNEGQGQPIGQLYKDTPSSEPTMRACVKAFIENELAEIDTNTSDTRQRLIRGTPKLFMKADEFRRHLSEFANVPAPAADSKHAVGTSE